MLRGKKAEDECERAENEWEDETRDATIAAAAAAAAIAAAALREVAEAGKLIASGAVSAARPPQW